MRDEDFFVDTLAQHFFVLLRRNDPSSYFYFPAEFTLPKGVKWKDIEPARRFRRTIDKIDYEIVLTRVHYWCLIIWVNPKKYHNLVENKPVIGFRWNFHTPYLFKNNYLEERLDIVGGKILSKKEKFFLAIALSKFKAEVDWKLDTPGEYPGVALEIKRGILEDGQGFNNDDILTKSAAAIIVGDDREIRSICSWLQVMNKRISIANLRRLLS